jgi:hypothetical protein
VFNWCSIFRLLNLTSAFPQIAPMHLSTTGAVCDGFVGSHGGVRAGRRREQPIGQPRTRWFLPKFGKVTGKPLNYCALASLLHHTYLTKD